MPLLTVFAYERSTPKTSEGLKRLFKFQGWDVEVVIAPWINNLMTNRTSLSQNQKRDDYEEVSSICDRFGFPWTKIEHANYLQSVANSEASKDLGLILGARILKASVIEKFRHGIVNLHPGLIPQNRGLDNIRWGVLLGVPQAVTAHVINDRVDHGQIIGDPVILRRLPEDPNLSAIGEHLLDLQMSMLESAISDAFSRKNLRSIIHKTPVRTVLMPTEEEQFSQKFPGYTSNYEKVVSDYIYGTDLLSN